MMPANSPVAQSTLPSRPIDLLTFTPASGSAPLTSMPASGGFNPPSAPPVVSSSKQLSVSTTSTNSDPAGAAPKVKASSPVPLPPQTATKQPAAAGRYFRIS